MGYNICSLHIRIQFVFILFYLFIFFFFFFFVVLFLFLFLFCFFVLFFFCFLLFCFFFIFSLIFYSETQRGCLPDKDVTGCIEMDFVGIRTRGCFCNTDLCNGSGGGRGTGDKERGGTGKGNFRLSYGVFLKSKYRSVAISLYMTSIYRFC